MIVQCSVCALFMFLFSSSRFKPHFNKVRKDKTFSMPLKGPDVCGDEPQWPGLEGGLVCGPCMVGQGCLWKT